MTNSVFQSLTQSKATLESHMALGAGRGLAIWHNDADRVRYEKNGLNTLSFYLQGGEETLRLDRGQMPGRTGSLCLLPQGSQSEWLVGAPFRFVHVYVSDERLRHFMAETLDRAPQHFALPDLTFYDEPHIAPLMGALASACAAEDAPAADALMTELYFHLITSPLHGGVPAKPVQGGLSRAVSRRIVALLHDHWRSPPDLDTLAAEAELSPFHFQRMFRISHGVSPHGYSEAIRIAKVRQMLAGPLPLAEIALACGYCHQSHLTRAFRLHMGVTPAAWRKAL